MYKLHGCIRLFYCYFKKLNIKTQVTHKVKERVDCLQFIFQMSQTTFTLTIIVIVNVWQQHQPIIANIQQSSISDYQCLFSVTNKFI